MSNKPIDICPKHIFLKGFEIFIFALIISLSTWACLLCPQEIEGNEIEDDFSEYEIHIGDAISMGNGENEVKGIPHGKLFTEDKSGRKNVKGVEAKQRTFISEVDQRKIIENLVNNREDKNALKIAIKKFNKKKDIKGEVQCK